MKRVKIVLAFFICLAGFPALGQLDEYQYRRSLLESEPGWHSITLPDEFYSKMETEFFDIRIIGFQYGDTVEAPYLVYSNIGESHFKLIDFEMINQSQRDGVYYYTFRLDKEETINEIKLNFSDQNFDWKVNLEGSFDQSDWFEILNDYRILAIRNASDRYEFSKLVFPDSNYKYYRVAIESEQKPKMDRPSISKFDIDSGKHKTYQDYQYQVTENTSTTEINIKLSEPKPLSKIELKIADNFDFYRPVDITCITDSIMTENGWIYNRKRIHSGILSSMEQALFKFNPVITNEITIRIFNDHNQALDINSIIVKGNIVELITRITQPANYFLYYGNEQANRPNYDIAMFQEKIPDNPNNISLGEEELLVETAKTKNPIYENLWLWMVMVVIVLFLGGFTFKMMRKN